MTTLLLLLALQTLTLPSGRTYDIKVTPSPADGITICPGVSDGRPCLRADAYVDAGELFTITHIRRVFKLRLVLCEDSRKRPPQTVDYDRWRNAANEGRFRAPADAGGCFYEIGGSYIKVVDKKSE